MKDKTKDRLLVGFLAFIIGSAVGGSSAYLTIREETVSEAWNNGFDSGYQGGYQDGYHAGYHNATGFWSDLCDPFSLGRVICIIVPLIGLFAIVGVAVSFIKRKYGVKEGDDSDTR